MKADTPKYEPRKAGWLPGSYAPSYLDGSLPGDVGFDPLCLAAYSWPAFQEKGLFLFGEPTPGLLLNLPDLSSEQRAKMLSELTAEEQARWGDVTALEKSSTSFGSPKHQ